MSALPLLDRLAAAGCSVRLEGGAVKVRGPREALTAEVVAELRQNKPELVEALSHRSARLRAAGDLAEAINRHCDACAICDRFDFTTDAPLAPLCRVGVALHRQYRAARRAALGEDLR